MKLEQFMTDYFKPTEDITVQAAWLQKFISDNAKERLDLQNELARTKRTLQGYQHKCDRLEAQVQLAQLHSPLRLDERA